MRWVPIAKPPLSPRMDVLMIGVDQALFVWGGRDSKRTLMDGAFYRVSSNSWSRISAPPLAVRQGPAAATADGKFVVWGGFSSETPVRLFDDGAVFDSESNRWSRMPKAPLSARANPRMYAHGEEILLWGGDMVDVSSAFSESFTDGAVFHTAQQSWTSIPPCPLMKRWGAHAAWLDKELLIWGGSPGRPHIGSVEWRRIGDDDESSDTDDSNDGDTSAFESRSEQLLGDGALFSLEQGNWRASHGIGSALNEYDYVVPIGTCVLLVGTGEGARATFWERPPYGERHSRQPPPSDLTTMCAVETIARKALFVSSFRVEPGPPSHSFMYDLERDEWRELSHPCAEADWTQVAAIGSTTALAWCVIGEGSPTNWPVGNAVFRFEGDV